MNKLYDENLYFFIFNNVVFNPLDFNYTKDGNRNYYDDYKIEIKW